MTTRDVPIELTLPHGKLLEGIVTTLNQDETPNIAPMGPIVDSKFDRLFLRPYRTSVTYQNLQRTGEGVFHVTDDVELFAHTALGVLRESPSMIAAAAVQGVILSDACRWYAFRVESLNDSQDRTEIVARVVDRGRFRDFFGFNRAKHAVIEAAILATRIEFLDAEFIAGEMERLAGAVEKTGGEQERRAFEFVRSFVEAAYRVPPGAIRQ